MQVITENHDSYVTLEIVGRIDASTIGELEPKALEIASNSSLPLLVSFAKVDYISSAGLRAILKLAKVCQSKKIDLVCFAMCPSVFEVFRISGFASIIKICDTLEQAQAKL